MSSTFSTINPPIKKHLGQNFLIDKNILAKIVKAGDINKKDVVLEIGPGKGILTFELAKQAKKVIAIEKDIELFNFLKQRIKTKNIKLIKGDALKEIDKIKGEYKVVSNIPYYLTSKLIRILLESENQPKTIVLMIQKEVAQRIKTKKLNLLALSVNYYADSKIVGYVSKNCFYPKPKVDSAIIKIIPKRIKRNKKLFSLAKIMFSSPRKQIAGTLSKGLNMKREVVENVLLSINIDPKKRPEDLEIKDLVDLTTIYAKRKGLNI